MTLLIFAVLGLATWRIGSMVAVEDGPIGIFGWFRDKVGVKYDEQSEPSGSNFFAEGIKCVWCNSIWIGIAFAIAYWFQPTLTMFIALPFSLSAVAIIVEEYVG